MPRDTRFGNASGLFVPKPSRSAGCQGCGPPDLGITVRRCPLASTAAGARDFYEAALVLVRPDQHVAWRGSQITDPQHLLDVVTGYASPASDQKTGGPLRHFTNSRAETTPGCPAGNHLPLRRGPWARFSATRAAIWPTSLLSCLRGRRAASRQATRADGAGISHAESAISPLPATWLSAA